MSSYQITTPFIYVIGWTDINAWYLGIRYAKGCQPIDLWTTYFTSSRHVATMRDSWGEPDLIEVIHTGSRKEVQEWEHELIKSLELHRGTRWLNRGTMNVFDGNISAESRERGRQKLLKRYSCPDERLRRKEALQAYYKSDAYSKEKRIALSSDLWSDANFKQQVLKKRKQTIAQRRAEGRDYSVSYESRLQGTSNRLSKLSADEVRAIRQITGSSNKTIGKQFGVSDTVIGRIRNGKSYRDVQ